jgi:hypothetical protein
MRPVTILSMIVALGQCGRYRKYAIRKISDALRAELLTGMSTGRVRRPAEFLARYAIELVGLLR